MTTMKTPGVYIQEKDAFGNSVVPVPTAVPAFIGYTFKTSHGGQNLVNAPVKISSLADFMNIFGDTPPPVKFAVKELPSVEAAKNLNSSIDSLNASISELTKKIADQDKSIQKLKDDPDKQAELTKSNEELKSTKSLNEKELEALVKVSTAPELANLLAASKGVVGKKDKALEDAQTILKDAVAEYALQPFNFTIDDWSYIISNTNINYRLYSAMKFFFANGGSDCYIVSIGQYDPEATALEVDPFIDAITLLEKEHEPTMIVVPDAVEIKDSLAEDFAGRYAGCYSVQNAALNHCGTFQNRVAILDVPGGYEEDLNNTPIETFRSKCSPTMPKFNSYGAAYYPWLHTNVNALSIVTAHNIDDSSFEVVENMVNRELKEVKGIASYTSKLRADASTNELNEADPVLSNLSTGYSLVKNEILKQINLLAPSAAMAGLYSAVDNSQGVWIAPANIAVQNVVTPAIKIDHAKQEDLNVPLNGKSICAIRAFTGIGTMVWGARTLDGNSNDWRYINVRRTLIFLEQSVKEAARAFVFAPNDAGTWVSVKSMISNFLTGIWKQGGLVGPSPDAAYNVSIGLGSTMSNDDILNGIMRITVKVAVSRPAEFIEITFQQQQQQA